MEDPITAARLSELATEAEALYEALKAKVNVDHDHRSGQIRGLLCQGCNKGLGMFRDDPMLLVRAANYLVPGDIAFRDMEASARASAAGSEHPTQGAHP